MKGDAASKFGHNGFTPNANGVEYCKDCPIQSPLRVATLNMSAAYDMGENKALSLGG